MQTIINQVPRILIAYSILLSLGLINSHAFGQKLFYVSGLSELEEIAFVGDSQKVEKMMKKDNWKVVKETNELGGKTYIFEKQYNPDIMAIYYKDGRLIVAKSGISPQFLYNTFVQEVKDKGFTKISTTTAKNKNGFDTQSYKWAKKGYPFQLIANHALNIAELHTNISIDYEKAPIYPPTPGQVFSEKFSSNLNNWMQEETDQFVFKIQNGVYKMQSKKGGSWLSTISLPNAISPSDDFEIAATLKKIKGTNSYYYGILVGFDRKTAYHHLVAITGDGRYVLANKGAQPKDIIPTSDNNIVKKGNATNHIRLQRINQQFRLYINDQLVGTTSATELHGNNFGFQIWSGNEALDIEVENLTIKTL